MHRRNTLLFVLFLFVGQLLFSQQITIPQFYEDKIGNKSMESNVEFYAYPYTSNQIDLRTFKKIYPTFEAPDYITIQAPDLSTNEGAMVLLGLLDRGKDGANSLVIWVAADYFSREVTFYIDRDMDRNYFNDGPAVTLKAGQRKQRVIIKPYGENSLSRELFLSVPRDQARKMIGGVDEQKKQKITNQFAIGGHAGFGSGSLTYEYDNLDTGFPAWYTVNMTEKDFGVNLSYNFSKFKVGLDATYQNIFYYTSYLNIRIDNPEIRIDPNTGRSTIVENVAVNRNKDIHAKNRIQWGLSVAYRIHIGSVEIQPTILGGITTYLPDTYTPDFSFEEKAYAYSNGAFLEGGLRAEFATGNGGAFFLGIHANKTWWQPEGYFESLNHENLKTEFLIWKGLLGYRVAIF